ncbi:MAG: hypothetical protein M1815_004516 [Lichina confinis]|nr:MAG: hypothetical protein M1815_004516 [Lichina confinis]
MTSAIIIFFPTLHHLQEEVDTLPEDEKHRGPTSSHACEVHHANVAHLTKAMEAYYGSRSWTYTEKTLQCLHLRLKQQKVEVLCHLVDSQRDLYRQELITWTPLAGGADDSEVLKYEMDATPPWGGGWPTSGAPTLNA